MGSFDTNLDKGHVLMNQALKMYEKGDFENGDKNRAEANKYFDLASEEIRSEEGQKNQLYGESRNFGIIYNVIEQNLNGDVLHDEKTKKLIKETYTTIKKDKILNEEFRIYDLFEKANNIENVKDFVNESLSLIDKIDKNEIKESNEKLIKIIRENKLDEFVEIPEDLENLYEAIEFTILNKKNFNNLNDFIKAQNVIVEHIENSQKKTVNEEKFSNEEMFNNFEQTMETEQKNIDESINEEEKKLLENFLKPNANQKLLFEEQKLKTLKKLTDVIKKSDDEDKCSWNEIYEKINNKEFSDKLSENIVSCAEMMEICSTIEE